MLLELDVGHISSVGNHLASKGGKKRVADQFVLVGVDVDVTGGPDQAPNQKRMSMGSVVRVDHNPAFGELILQTGKVRHFRSRPLLD